ncbi:uncharacterized protein LOC113281443 [Papaver somniferum]|uniref:uncharacterized protein LOC113281443 n=1 Tax=Papaver somniferum TaxID=3469 RepID=UPI000E7054F2|nr:uncharacterized protein LOC113281443 [Papaver somniferum]
MDAIKTIDTLKPYTQRRLYFRSDLEEGSHQFHYPLQDIIDFICTSWNIDDNPQPPTAKKVRGGAKLNFRTKMKKGEKVPLEFWQGAPVGPNANKISAYCGKLALNGENFPFDIHDWSEMPHKEA